MNIEHFQTSPAGKLLRVVEGEMAYWAFLPQPLPPALDADWELVGQRVVSVSVFRFASRILPGSAR